MTHTKPANSGRACAGARDERAPRESRRTLLKGAALLVAAFPWLAAAGHALAQAKASKASMKYQDKPNGGKDCASCLQFVPGPSASASGTCKVVEGPISPHGWCVAFVAKPPGK